MKPISHRGNLTGADPKIENNPAHIQMLLDCRMECEIDLWANDGRLSLGHDQPDYWVTPGYLKQRGLWIHCKNLAALEACVGIKASAPWLNYFWHQNDNYVVTSQGNIWAFPDQEPPNSQDGVIVDLSSDWRTKKYNCKVCVDWIQE